MKSDSERSVAVMTLFLNLKFDLHSIIRNFPARVSHFPILRAFFVEDRIRVVDVNQDFAGVFGSAKFFEQAAGSGKRQVANFAGGLRACARRNQFVLAPERSVEETEVARSSPFLPIA